MTLAALTTYRLTGRGCADWGARDTAPVLQQTGQWPPQRMIRPQMPTETPWFAWIQEGGRNQGQPLTALGQPNLASSTREPSLHPQRQIPFWPFGGHCYRLESLATWPYFMTLVISPLAWCWVIFTMTSNVFDKTNMASISTLRLFLWVTVMF